MRELRLVKACFAWNESTLQGLVGANKRQANKMYAEAYFETPGRIVRPPDSINGLLRVSVVPNTMVEAPGQFGGLREATWLNALGVSPDGDSEIFAIVTTSTQALNILMFNVCHFLNVSLLYLS